MRDLGLHKVAKGVRTVIVHLQWLFLAAEAARLQVGAFFFELQPSPNSM
jgi:hypothetical protein